MLDYTTKQIDEHIREVKEYYDKVPDAEQAGLVRVLQKNEGTTDYIRKYDELVNLFESCGRASLYLKNDIHKFKGYFYLAAKAGDICFKLYEKGYRTNSALCSNSMFEYRENMISYDTYAILSGCKELALSLVKEDSLLGSVIMGDYEKAKKYLPQNIKDIPNIKEFDQILWTIIYADEKKMNHYIKKSIESQRRYYKRCGYASNYMDGAILALIKLARERGMNCNLDIIELPMYVLDDNTPVNENEWKLPEDKELEKILAS